MKFDVNEISSLIKREVGNFKKELAIASSGHVMEVGDGIARIYGLEDAMVGEMLEFEDDIIGEVFNLDEESVGAVIYGDVTSIKEGSLVKSTGHVLTVGVGENLLGRVLDALGRPIDGKGEIQTDSRRLVDAPSKGIVFRGQVKEPLLTGIKCIDAMTPIGRGQRELIIGDRKTGKTAIALDTIINQKGKNVICVYVAIGQKDSSTIAEVVDVLKAKGAMDYTVVVAASASSGAPLQYIAPYLGCSIAEHFMYKNGAATLCVYDDLSKHAIAYRELSLMLRRSPGREAYPGDIFYLHSRLLERGVKLNEELGGGSLTALPIIETLEGQVSAYIPTNIISITDGQIYLKRNLFLSGIRPAVDVGISVSRVGGDAQSPAMKKVAGRLRLDLASFRELEDFARLGTELDKSAKQRLQRGYQMVEILKQNQYCPMTMAQQVVSIFAGYSGILDDIDRDQIRGFISDLIDWINLEASEYINEIEQTGELTDQMAEDLKEIIGMYKNIYRFSLGF
jgi:F-type H+/Na+-transporting ATPase subunit alpha